MSNYQVRVPGYRVSKGKVVRDQRRLSVSERLKQAASKKVRFVRKGQAR